MSHPAAQRHAGSRLLPGRLATSISAGSVREWNLVRRTVVTSPARAIPGKARVGPRGHARHGDRVKSRSVADNRAAMGSMSLAAYDAAAPSGRQTRPLLCASLAAIP